MGLLDLANKSPEEWDAAITAELGKAGIEPYKFREYDSPNSWVKHTLMGKLGEWRFSRNNLAYSFWGDIPLATAEVIAADKDCSTGSMPKQWLPSWGDQPDPAPVHSNYVDCITWISGDKFLVKEEGQSERMKEVLQKDANWKLLFVADPSDPKEGGKPFIQVYTFFTLEALTSFVAITKRHRLDFTYKY